MNMKKFDMNSIPDGAICCFIGKRKSGKSFCIRDLLYHKQDIPMCKVVSGSEEANPFFGDFMPSSMFDTDFEESRIAAVINRQRELCKKMKAEPAKYGQADPRMLVIFDDCLHDNTWQKSKPVKNIFMNGRHYKIFFILAMQYVLGIPPSLRTNIDYTFVFRDTSLQNRRKIYECFAGAIPTFDMFCQIMDSLDKYECLVLCNDADKVTLEEQVFWYKAKDNGDFRFGCDKMWKFDAQQKARKERGEGRSVSEYRNHKRNRVELKINKYQ